MLFVNQHITLDLVALGHVVDDPLDVARRQLEEYRTRRGARVVGHVAEDAPVDGQRDAVDHGIA